MSKIRFALFGALLTTVWACGGSGETILTPPDGGASFVAAGGTLLMRGNLRFADAAGNPVPAPAEGAIAVVGVGTKAMGTDTLGLFTIEGLPTGVNLRVRVFARGFTPLDFTVPSGTTQLTNQLICRQDTNAADDPPILNPLFRVGNDGVMRFTALSALNTQMTIFSSTALSPLAYANVGGDTLPVQSEIQGSQNLFTGTIGNSMPTGTFFALMQGPGGAHLLSYGTCQLNLANYNRGGVVVTGKITGPNGQGCEGAEVMVFEDGNMGNFGTTTSGAGGGGSFTAGLSAGPTSTVSVQVQWEDPVTHIVYVCWFPGNP